MALWGGLSKQPDGRQVLQIYVHAEDLKLLLDVQLHAELLPDLAPRAVDEPLASLQEPAWERPLSLVRLELPLDQEDAPLPVVD